MIKKQFSLQDETAAMKNIAAELEKLPQESQQRIVQWLMSIVGDITKPVINLERSQKILPPQGTIRESPKEFFHSKRPKNNYQKFAVLGYYLEFMKGKDEFDSQDLKIAWRQTREALPSQKVFSNSLNATLTTYNYFVSGSKKGLYRIGIKGQNLVETLPNQPKSLRRVRKKRSKTKSTRKANQ